MNPNTTQGTDPVEIMARAITATFGANFDSVEYEENERDDIRQLVRSVIAALEDAGWRIVHPEACTPEMMAAPTSHVSNPPPEIYWIIHDEWRTLCAAAPKYGTPAAPQKE